jgi:hypothetical protein
VTEETKYAFAHRVEGLVAVIQGRLSEVEAEPMAAPIFAMEARRLVEMLPTLLREHRDPSGTTWSQDHRGYSTTWPKGF